ncbi:MAG TPA: DUF4129 domain-containing protein [Actinomycetales bacterium]|nr:DUF4129 domain-containing protein [Actinomycetales bacterium]
MSRDGATHFRAAALRLLVGPAPVLAVVVIALALVSVVVVAAGPAQFGEPRLSILAGIEPPFQLSPGLRGAVDRPREQTDAGLPGWTSVLWILAVIAVLVLVVRWAVRLLRAAEARSAVRNPDDDTPEALAPLAAVRRAVRKASDVLTRPVPAGQEGDAVVRCWLALEDAAAQAGTVRKAAQTPTEFTMTLLAEHNADEVATAQLLRLYHRARFGSLGSRPLDHHAVQEARTALARIDASLARSAQLQDHDVTGRRGAR